MNAVPAAQAAKSLEVLIEKIIEDAEPTILLNEKGSKAVLMSLEEFNSWKETLYLLSNPANAKHLCRSLQETEADRTAERELVDP